MLPNIKNLEEKDNLKFEYCIEEEDKKELYKIMIEVIEEGISYPYTLPFSYTTFLDYFFPEKSKVIICKVDDKIAGGFYIKPNFPGKCSHIANAGYIVKKEYRGKKIGFYLGKCSIDTAKDLGYEALQFNLVFSKNLKAKNLWEKLGFKIIGTIPNAVKDGNSYQDAHILFQALKY